jgi:hypothetical protein
MWEFIATTDRVSLLCALGGAALVLVVVLAYLTTRGRRNSVELRSRWVLLALESQRQAEDLSGGFLSAGWDTQILPPGVGLGEFLSGFHPSLILLDRVGYGADLARLELSDARVASTPVLLVGLRGPVDRGNQHMRAWVDPGAKFSEILAKADQLVGRRPGPQQLSKLSEVRGPIRQGTLLELLYFLANARRTGRVEVTSGDLVGWIWLEGGEVRHCVLGREEGTAALHVLLDQERGKFAFRAGAASPGRTVKQSTIYLLHEYARLRDESAKMAGH